MGEDVSVQVDVTRNVLALEETRKELTSLKEKCKKLIVKVKQQDALLKEEKRKSRESVSSEAGSTVQAHTDGEYNELKEQLKDANAQVHNLLETNKELKDKSNVAENELQDTKEKYQELINNFDGLQAQMKNLQDEN